MNHFSDDEMRLARFIVRNRELGQRGLVFVIFLAAVVAVAVLGYQWLSFASGFGQDDRLELASTFQYIPFAALREKQTPQDLYVSQMQFVPDGTRQGDTVAVIHNPNTQWIAKEVQYEFTLDGVSQGLRTDFVLPTAEKYVFSFNKYVSSSVPNVKLNIIDVSWQRVRDPSLLQRLSALTTVNVQPKNNFELDQFELTGTLVNNAGYGFWSVGLPIVVSRQDSIVGVHYITLDMIRGFESRDFAVTWPHILSTAEKVRIIPDVNVFDDAVYMPVSASGGSDPSGVDYVPDR